jgi:peroxiredoxin
MTAPPLPPDLPVPVDDGAAEHLPGTRMPALALPSTDGSQFRVDRPPAGFDRLILYAYPRMGRPGEPSLTPEWETIPGAFGCTAETCGFRDHAADLAARGAAVAGVATQDTEYLREAVERLHLTSPLLSDDELRLTSALRLPTFHAAGHVLLKRLTLVVRAGKVEKVFYPVFPPDRHADEVLEWLRADPTAGP